jgi:putative ABC transport system permease protein
VPLSGHWANESFFSVFTFPMITGDPSTALTEPYSIVLTEKSAKKLFGDTDALGKAVLLVGENGDQEFVVTGVIKDVPVFSHIKFDMLASLSTRAITEKDNGYEMSWDHIWSGYVYLLLPKETDLQNLQTNLNTLSAKEDQTVKNTSIRLSLQPLSTIALGEDLNNSIGPVMVRSNVWMIGILSVIVILSACFNYTNLSIARSLRRSREVGIRKVVGALRSHVVGQFVVEAVMIALCSLVFAFGLFVLLLIAGLIALPAAQFFFVRYALDEYADTAPVAWNELLIGVMAVMSLAFLMIATHTLKVARRNPAQVLKSE